MCLFAAASGVFEGSDGGNRLPREFLDQDRFNRVMDILLRNKNYDLFYSITTFENFSNFTPI
jgi:hypothetical protein